MDVLYDQHLELSEALYWGKLFNPQQKLKTYRAHIGGGVACALPDHDILAFNRIIGMNTSFLSDNLLQEVIRFYREAGSKRFFLQLDPHGKSEDTIALLERNGFRLYNRWIKMALDAALMEPYTLLPSSLSVRQAGRSDADLFGNIIVSSFDWPADLASFFASSIGLRNYRHFLLYYKNKPVAAAALHMEDTVASMSIAGTLPEYRGMGAQKYLLRHRLNQAIESGCKRVVSETGEDSQESPNYSNRNMLKLGFREQYPRENYIFELPG